MPNALIYVRHFSFNLAVPETRPPHDLSNSFWHELSSPYTESSDENFGETTTQAHEPFFEENSSLINSTTQQGSDVFLHCRVNDLREKMVRKILPHNTTKLNWKIRKVSDVPFSPNLFR